MSITAKILNSDYTINSFTEKSAFEFMPGESKKLVIRLLDPANNLRYIPLSTSVIVAKFLTTDSELSKVGIMNANDRSIIEFVILASESSTMVGGTIIFEIDELGDGSQITLGSISNAMQKVSISC